MAVEVKRDLEFSEELVKWFWERGVRRQEKYPNYAISTSEWLKTVYEIKKELATVAEATGRPRPSCAIWGPSQTGKSTLISAYVDKKAVVRGVPGEDGTGSALHWPGGEPALFMDPKVVGQREAAPGTLMLNPFNSGKDASSCLSRFVYGSLTPKAGAYHVANPKYPIELRLVTGKDLLHTLARGFDSECAGHMANGSAKHWDIDKLQAHIASYGAGGDGAQDGAGVDRRAYELLHDFCEVLDDLIFSGLTRYRDLKVTERKYHSALAAILAEKSLVGSFQNAERFVSHVFWEQCEPMTRYYRLMREALENYEKQWTGKNIHCDIQTAVLLLDMDAYDTMFKPDSNNPRVLKAPEKVRKVVSNLGTRIDGDRVYIGQFPENRLFPGYREAQATSFAVLQGLVWEMMIPLNPDNLEESPFLQYLERADLLDFAGVANVAPNPSTRVHCECKFREKPEPSDKPVSSPDAMDSPPTFDASSFFTQILKRGKTASIVSTYAQRLTIDAFVVFQNIDGIPAVNAEQLQTGIKTWWRAMVPEYFKEHEGKRCPLPLNLGLLWWRKVFEEADIIRPQFVKYSWIWKNLGLLGDPKVVTSFALNYWGLARGQPNMATRNQQDYEQLFQSIKKDEAFREQFNGEVSQKSFDQMFRDFATGGADYFFKELAAQIAGMHQRGVFNRDNILQNKREENAHRIQGLLDARNLFPPTEEKDVRRENLEAFRNFLKQQVEKGRFLEPKMRAFNFALRMFLNINPDDLALVPATPQEIGELHIQEQYDRWINCKVENYRLSQTDGAENGGPVVDWALIGITSDTHCREYLSALVSSLSPPELKAITTWLIDLVKFAVVRGTGQADYRPYLAIRMTNAIVYGNDPANVPTYERGPSEDTNGLEEETSAVLVGKSCPSYQIFVQDFLERRLEKLIKAKVVGQVVPQDLPGVVELRQLCEEFGRKPKVYSQ